MARSTSLLRTAAIRLALLAGACSTSACQLVLGIGGELPLEQDGGSSGSGGTGTGTAPAGGIGGTAGTADEPSSSCLPGKVASCFTGRYGTPGVGICKSGLATCGLEGVWGVCSGEVVPKRESCATDEDEDCNGHGCVGWVETFVGEAHGMAMALDGQDNIVVAAVILGPIQLGDSVLVPLDEDGADAVLFKLDRRGHLLWTKVLTGIDHQVITAVATGPEGDIAIGGYTFSDLDLGSGTGVINPGGFVAKLDPDGKALWVRQAKSQNAMPSMNRLAMDSKGHVIVGGNEPDIDLGTGPQESQDYLNFFLAKLDAATGMPVWAKITQGDKRESLTAIAIDADDNIVLAGKLNGQQVGLAEGDVTNCCGHYAPFLARYAPDGSFIDGTLLAGFNAGGEELLTDLTGLALDENGVAGLAGTFEETADFASGTYESKERPTAFVLYHPPGDGQWSRAFLGPETAQSRGGRVTMDAQGHLVMSASYLGKIPLGNGPAPVDKNVFILKFDEKGSYLWTHTFHFGDGIVTEMKASQVNSQTVVLGTFTGAVDFGPEKIEAKEGFFVMKMGY